MHFGPNEFFNITNEGGGERALTASDSSSTNQHPETNKNIDSTSTNDNPNHRNLQSSTEEVVGWNIQEILALNVSDEFISNQKVCLFSSGYTADHEDLQGYNHITGWDDGVVNNEWDNDSSSTSFRTYTAGILAAIGGNGKGTVGIVCNGELNLHNVKVLFTTTIIKEIYGHPDTSMHSIVVQMWAQIQCIIMIPAVFTTNNNPAVASAIDTLYYKQNVLFVSESYTPFGQSNSFPGNYG